MTIQLTAAQTLLWNGPTDWKTGYLAALQAAVAAGELVVRIVDDVGAPLATYARIWTAQ